MRLAVRSIGVLALAAWGAVANGQIWEKRVGPGLVYREEVDLSLPIVVHALRFSIGSPDIRAASELAELTVFEDNQSKGRETISDLVVRTNALGGINGDFFPFTGKPLGAMVRNGEFVSAPSVPRAVFGWGPKDAEFGQLKFQGSVEGPSGVDRIKIDDLNAECGLNEIVLDTETANLALSKLPNLAVVVKAVAPKWSTDASVEAEVVQIAPDFNDRHIASGEAVIVATGAKMAALSPIHKGDRLTIRIKLTGFDWSKIHDAVSGGPFLVRDGKVGVDWEAEGFKTAFSLNRHPRTMLGKTAQGDVWIVVVDGRSSHSVGATLEEGARIMLRLGCVDALNFDGGGSSTLNLHGVTLNRPSDGEERKVANAILLFGSQIAKPVRDQNAPILKIATKIKLGSTLLARIVDGSGARIPNADVLWSASGSGWIDQGGLFRPLTAGKAKLVAYVHGWTVSASVDVLPAQ